MMQSPEPQVKPRAVQVCLLLVRLLLLSVGWLVLLIGLAWVFGAFWFDFPVSALRRPLAAVFGLCALICHTFVSFDFGPEGYVCISIETRMTKGQAYSALAGLYRQFALYYVMEIALKTPPRAVAMSGPSDSNALAVPRLKPKFRS
jgi:hypothetical protein